MPAVKLYTEAERADRHRNAMAKRSRDAHAAASDIGTIPPIGNLERRVRCESDLHAFLVEYFPESTGLAPFGDAQVRAIKRIENAILKGGRFLNLFPRGFSKSTISENAMIWCVLYGHREYGVFFGAKQDDASGAIESIKKELAENDRIEEDFPEVVVACQALEGKPQRCGSQNHHVGDISGSPLDPEESRLTHIEWTAETIVMPSVMVPGGWGHRSELDWSKMQLSPASGSIIRTKGLMGASRGLRYKKPDGRQIRPDFCVVDDPQTEESAVSPVQVAKRLKVIQRSILRLGGHGNAVACVINATIMEDGDLPDTLADPDKHPEWEVERIQMVIQMPSEKVLETYWQGEYARIRRDYDRAIPGDREKAVIRSTQYYAENQLAMDEGFVVAWPDIPLEEHEISAIQHAMNILVDDGEEVFASECQNEPKRMVGSGVIILSDRDLAQKTNGHKRTVVPEGCGHVVFHIDVHDAALYWAVAAVGDDLTGSVIDYGTWPEQPSGHYFTLRTVKRTMMQLYGLRGDDPKSIEQAIQEGIGDCIDYICTRQWVTPGGLAIPVTKGLVDIGYKPEQVAAAIRGSDHKAVLFASRGVGTSAGRKEMTEYDTSPSKVRRAGPDPKAPRWYIPAGNTYGIQIVRFDVSFWKDTLQARLATPTGSPGAWCLYGSHQTNHRHFAGHLTSQLPAEKMIDGKTVNIWELKPNREDHWYDNTVGCLVAASLDGCNIPGWTPQEIKSRKKLKLSELQKKKHAGKRI